MSVIVTGMDMPIFCGQCGGCYDYDKENYFCALSDIPFDVKVDMKRPKQCPLKSIDELKEIIAICELSGHILNKPLGQIIDEYCEIKKF